MFDFIKKHKIPIIIVLVIIIAAAVYFSINRSKTANLLNEEVFNEFAESIESRYSLNEGFEDQAALRDFITSWADSRGLEYKTDDAGNIIFNMKAVERKKNLSASVVFVSYNYETAAANAKLLASAAAIADTSLDSSRKTVIFVNDEKNSGSGYKSVNKKYIKGKSKVIYMDYGSSSYISASSFGFTRSYVTVPYNKKEKVTCDTAVRVHISGISPGEVGTGISKQPSPVSALSSLLTRLQSRSTVYQLADLSIGTDGRMYPVSLDATFVLNSYSVASFTKYIDNRIKAWEKNYAEDHPELSYTYEVIDDEEELPEKAYSSKASSSLANVLYTIQNGTYKYQSNDEIPEGRKEGDLCGINCITGIRTKDGNFYIDLTTQAYNEAYMNRITGDNEAASELFGCTYTIKSETPRFVNDKDSLYRTFTSTYSKISSGAGSGSSLKEEMDNYFTPCSYLDAKNSEADIIHLRLNDRSVTTLTNTILIYMESKGNILSF